MAHGKNNKNDLLSHVLVDKTVNLAVIAGGRRVRLIQRPCTHIAHNDSTSSPQQIMPPFVLTILPLRFSDATTS